MAQRSGWRICDAVGHGLNHYTVFITNLNGFFLSFSFSFRVFGLGFSFRV